MMLMEQMMLPFHPSLAIIRKSFFPHFSINRMLAEGGGIEPPTLFSVTRLRSVLLVHSDAFRWRNAGDSNPHWTIKPD
jgi:hypothetical protein